MKHVFYVMSHLTFSITNKIVELDKISSEDCILLLARDYRIPEKYNSNFPNQIHTSYNVSVNQGRVFAGVNIIKTITNVCTFDKMVDDYIKGEDFLWYTSVCSNDICSLMVTKKNCKGFYVLEDGMSSYRNYNPQTFTGLRYWVYRLLLRPMFNRIFNVKNHFISDDSLKFKGCIATNSRCFPLHQHCLRVIGLPFENVELEVIPEAVLSVDPLFMFVDEPTTSMIYQKLASYIESKGYKSLSYKFHPRFNAQSARSVKEMYKAMMNQYFSIPLIEFSPDVIIENVLKTYKCDFYTLNSAVAIYGSVAGAHCYSYIPLLKPYTDAFNVDTLTPQVCTFIES